MVFPTMPVHVDGDEACECVSILCGNFNFFPHLNQSVIDIEQVFAVFSKRSYFLNLLMFYLVENVSLGRLYASFQKQI